MSTIYFCVFETLFLDFYKIAGLRGVYIASQLPEGISEENIRPSNLTTLITFDAGAEWSTIQGPKTDNQGNPLLGCYQVRPVRDNRAFEIHFLRLKPNVLLKPTLDLLIVTLNSSIK